jgi:hypothetical protein
MLLQSKKTKIFGKYPTIEEAMSKGFADKTIKEALNIRVNSYYLDRDI